MYQLNLAGTIIAQIYTSSRRQLCAKSGSWNVSDSLEVDGSFDDDNHFYTGSY